MRFIVATIFLVTLFFLSSFKTLNNTIKQEGVKTVVIDAGHGGHDPGCQYGGIKEKNVALAVALKFGKLISQNMKDVKVIYTRDKDEFVDLWQRADIANHAKADVFISIHCNANKNKAVFGTETFTMGPHKSSDNLDVAKRENEVVTMEDNYKKKYEGFDPSSPEAEIIFSLFQSAYVEQSLHLASKVESEFSTCKRHSRGVKQAGFVVLWKTAMPSILIETGFLSNTSERATLTAENGQAQLATNIYNAFKKYKQEMEATRK